LCGTVVNEYGAPLAKLFANRAHVRNEWRAAPCFHQLQRFANTFSSTVRAYLQIAIKTSDLK